jgi:hypothetical protein
VWDGHRTVETPAGHFDGYARELVIERGVDPFESARLAEVYVSSPDSVFPHGTDGTVELTLTANGEPAPTETAFDEFVTTRACTIWSRVMSRLVASMCGLINPEREDVINQHGCARPRLVRLAHRKSLDPHPRHGDPTSTSGSSEGVLLQVGLGGVLLGDGQ